MFKNGWNDSQQGGRELMISTLGGQRLEHMLMLRITSISVSETTKIFVPIKLHPNWAWRIKTSNAWVFLRPQQRHLIVMGSINMWTDVPNTLKSSVTI